MTAVFLYLSCINVFSALFKPRLRLLYVHTNVLIALDEENKNSKKKKIQEWKFYFLPLLWEKTEELFVFTDLKFHPWINFLF